MLVLKGVVTDTIQIGDRKIEVKGLSRKDVLTIQQAIAKRNKNNNTGVDDLDIQLVKLATNSEEDAELLLSLPNQEFAKVVELIMKLSGMEGTPQTKK